MQDFLCKRQFHVTAFSLIVGIRLQGLWKETSTGDLTFCQMQHEGSFAKPSVTVWIFKTKPDKQTNKTPKKPKPQQTKKQKPATMGSRQYLLVCPST